MCEKTKIQKNRRRYKLHYLLRKAGYTVKTSEKTVEIPFQEFEEKTTPTPFDRYINELRELNNYGIQSVFK